MSTKPKLLPSTPKERAAALLDAGITADKVLNTIQIELGIETDQQLAALFGVSKTTVSTWRSRNSVPYDLVLFLSLTAGLDLNYTLTRRGRISGFLKPSESIDDPRLQREILATALADVVPVRATRSDVERAADALERRRAFYRELVLREHQAAPGFMAGKYVEFACEVLRTMRASKLPPGRTK